MKIEEVIIALNHYNTWRNGGRVPRLDDDKVTEAINCALTVCENYHYLLIIEKQIKK